MWGAVFFLGFEEVREDQRRGEDIEAKEEGIGWGMVTLLDKQYQVVQDAGKSAHQRVFHMDLTVRR